MTRLNASLPKTMKHPLSRREMLRVLAVAPVLLSELPCSAAASRDRSRLGVDMNSYGIRFNPATPAGVRFKNVFEMLEHCDQLGAAGIQARIEVWEKEFIKKVREKL